MYRERSSTVTLIAIAVAIFATYVIVWSIRYGAIHSNPIASYFLLAFVVTLPAWPRFRHIATGSSILALAAIAFAGYGMWVGRGYASWWPTKHLGLESIIGLPVLLVCVAAEIGVPSSFAAHVHPSSPVAAAAFMRFSTIGADVTTSYHSPNDRPTLWQSPLKRRLVAFSSTCSPRRNRRAVPSAMFCASRPAVHPMKTTTTTNASSFIFMTRLL